ncbi:MAG: glycoside hydrolase family 125 protein [Lachnospiraceae bacterium]|nr:glycoside hydrolase family 125 protein [Lachnospiraceae bacterium]
METQNKYNRIVGKVKELAEELTAKLKDKADEKTLKMFKQCFMSTAETTLKILDDGSVYLITGDIKAMWLRDSSAQVVHYLPFAKDIEEVRELISGLIRKQFFCINMDPYANAFNPEPNGACWEHDITDMTDWEWERKYEVDSLCYPVKLLCDYFEKTKDKTVICDEIRQGLSKIIDVFKCEQKHFEDSPYRFTRVNCPPGDTLHNNGMGEPVGFTGMTWSGFRPSDDACRYGYLIPSNLFAAAVLKRAAALLKDEFHDTKLSDEALKLSGEITEGIEKYGVIKDSEFGEIYTYETDGLGNTLFMDDANVPSLMSLPWLGVCEKDDARYLGTRRAVLSHKNPYYYEGKAAKGIGSPHTPENYIWHISLCMQGLTSDDENERAALMEMLKNTDAGTGFMHEGFDKDDPEKFTRSWFAWANSLFALFTMDHYGLI